ncbi:hypothetical protein [Actinoplanes sp. M2I2]|uniref:hypothetical protein n=1 Tax=Actinoplanes sp. M2I2 TaxID=1734444 RepID=UPI002020AC53|nr:hypothetical protein [Actinoplanes sp. M2I2]
METSGSTFWTAVAAGDTGAVTVGDADEVVGVDDVTGALEGAGSALVTWGAAGAATSRSSVSSLEF